MGLKHIDTADLKVGDDVAVMPQFGGEYATAKYLKVTRTFKNYYVELSDGSKWTKNGRKVGEGDSSYRSSLWDVAEAKEHDAWVAKTLARRKLYNRVRDLGRGSLDELTDDQLARFTALMDEVAPVKEEEAAS